MSTADAALIALGERFERRLLEYMDAWLAWAPLMRAARAEVGPAVIRVRTAKSAVAGDHLLHAHFVGWQTAIVMKGMARTSARAPGHLSGLADAKVEQHCQRYGHYDEH